MTTSASDTMFIQSLFHNSNEQDWICREQEIPFLKFLKVMKDPFSSILEATSSLEN